MGFLTQVVERVRGDLRDHPLPQAELVARAADRDPPLDFAQALAGDEMSLIAEVKRASPSAGPIAATDPAGQAGAYERGGAAAISVLTEAQAFAGSPSDLEAVRAASRLPILRKDFVVAESQVVQSRAMGADAVLLISAALSRAELAELVAASDRMGLAALVEAHGPADLEAALASGSRVVGVNARDLETLEVDLDRALAMAAEVPADRILVLESGIASRRDVVRAGEAGARAVLVGEALMRSRDPSATVAELLGHQADSDAR